MLKNLQNLFDDDSENLIMPGNLTNRNQYSDVLNSATESTDFSESQKKTAAKKDLSTDQTQDHGSSDRIDSAMVQLLQQQRIISESYQKLAAAFKEQGNPEQAAEYYRQAIMTKNLIPSKMNHRSGKVASLNSRDLPVVYNLSDNAFSFLPLVSSTSNPPKNQEKALKNTTLSEPKSVTPTLDSPVKEVKTASNSDLVGEMIQLYAQQALDSYDNAQWQETIDACHKIIEIAPKMAEAYKILGNALQRKGETSKAMDYYSKALKIEPDLAIVYAGIGQLYYQQQKWLKAKEYYQKATIINPKYYQAYLNLAYVWQQLEQPEKAEFCQKRAAAIQEESASNSISLVPDNNLLPTSIQAPEAILTYYKLAQNFEQNQKWQEAALHYRKAVELNNIYFNSSHLNPRLPRHNNHQSQIELPHQPKETLRTVGDQKDEITSLATNMDMMSQSQIERAMEYYRYQAKIKPSSAEIQFLLGNLSSKKEQWNQAIAFYEQAIKIEPTYGKAYINLSQALAKIGRQAESLEQLYLGYTIKPELADADSLFNLGQSLVKQGERKRAVNCFSFAINLKPDFLRAYHDLAATLIKLGRKQEAVDCYRKAIKHNPHDTHSHFLLGEQHTANRQWDNAVAAYRKVLELQPKYPQASYKLSYALSEKLRSDLADRDLIKD